MGTQWVALPEGLRWVLRSRLERMPWRNGRGWTSMVAEHAVAGQVLWRVSIAEIQQASPFSFFPGLDRTAVLIQGGPLALIGPDRRWALRQAGDVARFPGELAVHNTHPQHAALVWNVMTHRGRGHAEVFLSQGQAFPMAFPMTPGTQVLVWVLEGRYHVVGPALPPGPQIGAGEGLHWSGQAPGPSLVPAGGPTRLLCTRLFA